MIDESVIDETLDTLPEGEGSLEGFGGEEPGITLAGGDGEDLESLGLAGSGSGEDGSGELDFVLDFGHRLLCLVSCSGSPSTAQAEGKGREKKKRS